MSAEMGYTDWSSPVVVTFLQFRRSPHNFTSSAMPPWPRVMLLLIALLREHDLAACSDAITPSMTCPGSSGIYEANTKHTGVHDLSTIEVAIDFRHEYQSRFLRRRSRHPPPPRFCAASSRYSLRVQQPPRYNLHLPGPVQFVRHPARIVLCKYAIASLRQGCFSVMPSFRGGTS
jgi:hypothetical protein